MKSKLRKQQDEALRQSEQRYRSLFENNPVPLWVDDFSGVKKYLDNLRHRGVSDFRTYFMKHPEDVARCSKLVKIIDINEAALDMYKAKTLKDVLPRIREVIPNESMDGFREELVALAEGKNRFESEFTQTVAGIKRNISLMLSVIPGYEDTLSKVLVSIIDLTERKRTEEELRKSNQFLESIIDNAKVWLDVIDQEGNVLVWNKAAELITGYSTGEVRGHGKVWDWLYPDEEYRKRIMNLAPGGQEDVETIIRRKDGESRTISWNQKWLVSDKCETIGTIVIGRDITEQKRMASELKRYSEHLEEMVEERAQDLRSEKERLEYVIESNPAVIYLSKPLPDLTDFYSIYKSKNVVSLTGFESEEFIGAKGVALWQSRVHPDDLISYKAGIPEFWRRGHQVCEYRFLHKNGTYRWIREEVNLSRDPDGKVRDVIGYWSDVTERKRMEENLQASMERLDFLITANPAAIFSAKPHSDLQDFDRTYFSRNITSILGYAPEDFINDPKFWERHVHPDDLSRVKDSLSSLFREGHVSNDYRFLHKDGNYRWIRGKMRAITDETGKPTQIVGYWTDVTEEKRLEEALLKSERLAAIGGAAAMVGHDLRNPLQSMTGALYLLKNLSVSERIEDRKEALELLNTLDDQIRYMDKIVSDLQSYAAPIAPEPTETDLGELIKSVISYVRIPENVVTTVIIPKELTKATVDSVLLRRVVTNLVLNAVQAMPNGGNLTVSANKEQESVTVTVEDTGEGIPGENVDKLFNPFFTTKSKGQGLGLAVCKRLIEAQNGAITVKSELGKGSRFTAILPFRSAMTREPTPEP